MRVGKSCIRPPQFVESGCDNCTFLSLEGDRGRVSDYTTPNFSGCEAWGMGRLQLLLPLAALA